MDRSKVVFIKTGASCFRPGVEQWTYCGERQSRGTVKSSLGFYSLSAYTTVRWDGEGTGSSTLNPHPAIHTFSVCMTAIKKTQGQTRQMFVIVFAQNSKRFLSSRGNPVVMHHNYCISCEVCNWGPIVVIFNSFLQSFVG